MIDAATKKARAKVMKLAASLGATVKVRTYATQYDVGVEAPEGHHWSEGVHEFKSSCFVGPWSYDIVWTELLQRMDGGVEPCGTECEWWGETDDNDTQPED